MKLFLGLNFTGSRERFWEAFGEDFRGPGRLLGSKIGEKRREKRSTQKEPKKTSNPSLRGIPKVRRIMSPRPGEKVIF